MAIATCTKCGTVGPVAHTWTESTAQGRVYATRCICPACLEAERAQLRAQFLASDASKRIWANIEAQITSGDK